MSLDGQRIQPDRYKVIPRTLTFLLSGDEILLIRVAPGRGGWSGMLNGLGGHIERGESPFGSALREVNEETGLVPQDLRLCGVVIVDTGGDPGIGLYVFVGETQSGSIPAGPEGQPVWHEIDRLADVELVEDLPALIPRAIASYRGAPPFSAAYVYDRSGALTIQFAPP
jgi:8-oxo-dGTP diphosphatase